MWGWRLGLGVWVEAWVEGWMEPWAEGWMEPWAEGWVEPWAGGVGVGGGLG